MRTLLASLLLFPVAAVADPIDTETVARDAVRELVDGKYDAVEARFSEEMAKAVTREKLSAVTDPIRGERAPARSVIVRLRNDHADGAATFTVKANWSRGAVSDVSVTVRSDGKITGMTIHDEAPPIDRFDKYELKTKIRAPFRGTWTARNASPRAGNGHYANANQRFAIDWSMEGANGKTYKTDGRKNEDYLCYGQDALAVADGTVAIAVDGIPENHPGQMDTYYTGGNSVVLDLGNGEFALYAHFIPGSLQVKVGQKVHAGDLLAKVGNSGNSSEPHLHFQISNRARLLEAAALPARFSNVTADGKKADRVLPTDGMHLSPADGK